MFIIFFLYKGRQVSTHAEALLSFSTFGPEVETGSDLLLIYIWVMPKTYLNF